MFIKSIDLYKIMKLEKKLKYQQLCSIKIKGFNEALTYHLMNKEHGRQKYAASKHSRRLYREKK